MPGQTYEQMVEAVRKSNTKYNLKTKEKRKISRQAKKERNKQHILNAKMAGCQLCPENDPVCLDFHHKNPKEKHKSISYMQFHAISIESIDREIAKCDLLCANCHRKHHAKEPLRSGVPLDHQT